MMRAVSAGETSPATYAWQVHAQAQEQARDER
jgi:hypothetical protein